MPKTITLQGNVPTDKLEVEIWDGCMIFTSYSTHEDADAGEVCLLMKEEVDRLRVQLALYYNTLKDNDLISGYTTVWEEDDD